MKKLFLMFILFCTTILIGCKTIPDSNTLYKTSESIGYAAGYAVELNKTNTEIKDTVVKILDITTLVIPETNETFSVVWKPIISSEIEKLVVTNKLKLNDSVIAKKILYIACDGLDLIFIRYPKIHEYKDLVSVAVNGFNNGFKNVIIHNGAIRSEYDKESYLILNQKFKNM